MTRPLELVAPGASGDDPAAGGAAATASPAITAEEFDAILGTIWEGLDEDQTRFNDLLWDALGFIGTLATRRDIDPQLSGLAAQCLRGMEQRALWGPDLEQEDHR